MGLYIDPQANNLDHKNENRCVPDVNANVGTPVLTHVNMTPNTVTYFGKTGHLGEIGSNQVIWGTFHSMVAQVMMVMLWATGNGEQTQVKVVAKMIWGYKYL